jgi:hypothetical protein
MRRITPEGRLADYHPEVGKLWRSRHEEPEQEVFKRLPPWMAPESDDVDRRIDLERLCPKLLEGLPPKEKVCLEFRFWGDRTLDDVGQFFRVTKERVRQIEAKALRHARRDMYGLYPFVDRCPVEQRKQKEEAERDREWYAKWREDQLIEKLLRLRENT